MKSIKIKHFCYLCTAFFILMTFTITLLSQEKSTDKLFGTYLFIKESSEYSLGEDAQILLKLQAPNIATIIATKPGIPSVTDTGTFSIQGNKITISFPALGKEATNADYSFDGKQLILPFLAIDDGEGTSTWEKIEYDPHDLIEVISLYHKDLLAHQSRESALEKMKIRLEKNPRVKKVGIVPGKSILITYESGYQEFFLTLPGFYDSTSKSSSAPKKNYSHFLQSVVYNQVAYPLVASMPLPLSYSSSRSQFISDRWLKTGIYLKYEPEPISRGDAPKYKNALILSAFHTLPIYISQKEGVKYLSFKDMGENLDEIIAPLKKIGYQTSPPYIDGQVTVANLYKLFNQSWGVVYFNTHGGVTDDGDFILATGEQVPIKHCRSDAIRDRYVQNYLKKRLGNKVYNQLAPYILVGYVHDIIPFICVRSGFFKQTKGDFSSSLVFINGCDSAMNDRLRKAINPRAYLGWLQEIDMILGGDINGPLWKCLCKKTRSAREAYDYSKYYLLEVKAYKYKRQQSKGMDPYSFALFRQNSNSPVNDFTNAQRRMITAVREYAWLKKRADNPEDLLKLVNTLYTCTKSDINGMKNKPFCRKAFVRERASTKEIDEIKGELCGYGGTIARSTLIEK
jgi:hypothetical protein